MAENEELSWRETYFVLFPADHRPTMTQVEAAIADASNRLTVEHLEADDDGLFASVVVQAPEDNAAMEISFESGDSVAEQSAELAKKMRKRLAGEELAKLLRSDARFDIMHFERIVRGDDDLEEPEEDDLLSEALDPASLITVVEALTRLTGGIAIDPAAGEIMA